MTSVYDQKTATEMYERALRAEGIEQGSISVVLNLFKHKYINLETALKVLNMSKLIF